MSEHTEADDFCIAQLITGAATVASVAALESARAQRAQQPTHHDQARSERAHFVEGLPMATLTTSSGTRSRGR